MQKIQSFSRKVRILFQALLFITPLLVLFYWMNIEKALAIQINPFAIPNSVLTFNLLSKTLGFGISMMNTGVIMWLLYCVALLFKNYEKANIFSIENVKLYKKLGKGMFYLALIEFLSSGLLSVALSFQNEVGKRFLSISFGTPEIIPMIIGLVILGISYVMEEAHHLENEARLTV